MSNGLAIPQSVEQLSQLLLKLNLVPANELRLALARVDKRQSVPDVLKSLEQQHLLTPYQTGRIEKGEIDSLVIGGCKLLYQNASGSFARVYRACRVDNGQMIGIKVLRDRWARDPDSVALFRREGEIGQRLKHPHIVPTYEVGQSGRFHYITMEFVEGGNLRDFMKIRKKLVPEEALRYGLHIARGLEGALAVGMTHRDMKTTNVLLTLQGVAKLIDFGLASDDALAGRNNDDLAQALEYATLEKNTGAPKNDPRSDLFFLGGILYELLSGELPYPRTRDRDERKNFSRYRDIKPLAAVAPDLPLTVTRVVSKLLETSPFQRYQSPTELAADLEKVLTDLGHPPPPTTPSAAGAISKDAKVLLCVEHRPNRQNLLRDYFSKKGYRVLLLPDGARAVSRLKNTPAEGVIFFADSAGVDVKNDYEQALAQTEGQKTAVVMVLAESDQALAQSYEGKHPRGVVLSQPINLRLLRKSMEQVLKS